MKLLGWGLAVLLAVWLAAFVGIKLYDLGCVASPSICFAETGIWLRKLVLLEWASKWQTLLAGIGAVVGGAFVLFAAKIQIEHQRALEETNKIEEVVNSLYLVSNYLYRASNEYKSSRGDSLSIALRSESLLPTLTRCSPILTAEVLRILEHFRTKSLVATKNKIPTALFMYAASCLFAQSAKYLQKRKRGITMIRSEIRFPSNDILNYISSHGGDIKNIHWLSEYFDIPAEAKETAD